MATALSAHLQSHCHWITSPAVRARTTAHRMARQLQFDTQKIEEDEALYHASVGTLQAVVERQPESIEQLVLFGHNPGLTSLCNAISSVRLDNLPTCGIFAVTWPGKQWAPLPMGQATFDFFDIPKHYK